MKTFTIIDKKPGYKHVITLQASTPNSEAAAEWLKDYLVEQIIKQNQKEKPYGE